MIFSVSIKHGLDCLIFEQFRSHPLFDIWIDHQRCDDEFLILFHLGRKKFKGFCVLFHGLEADFFIVADALIGKLDNHRVFFHFLQHIVLVDAEIFIKFGHIGVLPNDFLDKLIIFLPAFGKLPNIFAFSCSNDEDIFIFLEGWRQEAVNFGLAANQHPDENDILEEVFMDIMESLRVL